MIDPVSTQRGSLSVRACVRACVVRASCVHLEQDYEQRPSFPELNHLQVFKRQRGSVFKQLMEKEGIGVSDVNQSCTAPTSRPQSVNSRSEEEGDVQEGTKVGLVTHSTCTAPSTLHTHTQHLSVHVHGKYKSRAKAV